MASILKDSPFHSSHDAPFNMSNCSLPSMTPSRSPEVAFISPISNAFARSPPRNKENTIRPSSSTSRIPSQTRSQECPSQMQNQECSESCVRNLAFASDYEWLLVSLSSVGPTSEIQLQTLRPQSRSAGPSYPQVEALWKAVSTIYF